MDPVTNAIVAPWAQYGVVGAVVLALGFVCWKLWQALDKRTEAHMAAVEKCHDTTLDMMTKNIEAQNRQSDAYDKNTDTMKAVLEALKK